MAEVTLPYNIQNGQKIDATPVMANFGALVGTVNGGIDATNVLVGTPVAQSSVGGLSSGSAAGLALADHKHILQGWEQLAGDPSSGNFVGRQYYDTTNNRTRLCISTAGSGTWVTTGNLASSDLPNHASRHAAGGPDALPSGSVDQTMLTRPLTTGQPSGDVTVSGTSSWNDVVTGVAPTVTGTQLCLAIFQVAFSNGDTSNTPAVNFRMIDQGSNVRGITSAIQMGNSTSNSSSKVETFVWPFVASAAPTLKVQVTQSATGVVVHKTSSPGAGGSGPGTALWVIVG